MQMYISHMALKYMCTYIYIYIYVQDYVCTKKVIMSMCASISTVSIVSYPVYVLHFIVTHCTICTSRASSWQAQSWPVGVQLSTARLYSRCTTEKREIEQRHTKARIRKACSKLLKGESLGLRGSGLRMHQAKAFQQSSRTAQQSFNARVSTIACVVAGARGFCPRDAGHITG